MSIVYDAGLLIAADRGDRTAWARHRAILEDGLLPMTTAPVVAQVSRTPRQARLRVLLQGCTVAAFAPEAAHEVGALLAVAGTSDVVDAHLVLLAARTRGTIVTTDRADLEVLAERLPAPIRIEDV